MDHSYNFLVTVIQWILCLNLIFFFILWHVKVKKQFSLRVGHSVCSVCVVHWGINEESHEQPELWGLFMGCRFFATSSYPLPPILYSGQRDIVAFWVWQTAMSVRLAHCRMDPSTGPGHNRSNVAIVVVELLFNVKSSVIWKYSRGDWKTGMEKMAVSSAKCL